MQARLIPAHAGKTFSALFLGEFNGAHPRACGENDRLPCIRHIPSGSSPRMRGKLKRVKIGDVTAGLIPAHAGKTFFKARKKCSSRAHPRACGENVIGVQRFDSALGSSPRMRGKQSVCKDGDKATGLIPAHAGKTWKQFRCMRESRAHPRACGENDALSRFRGDVSGSSPRMRGKHSQRGIERTDNRLIPAHAGKTRGEAGRSGKAPAHPRACGENRHRTKTVTPMLGSSPRMRGKHRAITEHTHKAGLIPAHAGKTTLFAPVKGSEEAHPRACGENSSASSVWLGQWGSSPRMRGKLTRTSWRRISSGLIPAHAGKTGERRHMRFVGRAHPRACGENIAPALDDITVAGSSPRMRGKRHRVAFTPYASRLIPAHAGKTTRQLWEHSQVRAHPRACGENQAVFENYVMPAGSSPRMRGKPRG